MKLFVSLTFVLVFFHLQADTQSEIKILHDSAYTLLNSNPKAAMLIGIKTEEMAEKKDLIWEEANSIFIQAWLHEEKHESGKAFILYLKAIEILRPFTDNKREADLISLLLGNIGLLLKEHHAIEQAYKFLDEGIIIAEKHGLSSRLTDLYSNKAETSRLAGKKNLAYENISQALKHSKKSINTEIIVDCLNLKGVIEIDSDQPTQAIESFDVMINYVKEFSLDSSYLGQAWHNIGFSYIQIGEYGMANYALRKSLQIKECSQTKSVQFVTLLDLCDVYMKTDSIDKALQFALRALGVYDLVEVRPENYNLFEFLSQIYFEKNEFNLSRKYTKRYIEENEKFLKLQEKLMQTKNEYQMELLTAGFFTQQNANRKESLYLTLLSVVTSIFTLILIAGITRQYYKRRSIKRSLMDLDLNL